MNPAHEGSAQKPNKMSKGWLWLKLQAIPLTMAYIAEFELEGALKMGTLITAFIAGVFFCIKQFHEYRTARRIDLSGRKLEKNKSK